MSNDILGKVRFDAALVSTGLTAQAEKITDYFDMANYQKAIFIIEQSSMQATYGTTGGVILRRIQATSSTGANAITAGSSAELAMGTTYTVSSTSYVLSKASYVVLTCNTSAKSGDTIKINDVTYTVGAAAGTSSFTAARLLVTSSYDGLVPHLTAFINHADYGVSGVTALQATRDIILTADATPISITITGSNTSGGLFVAGYRQTVYLAFDSAEIAASSSYRYVAVGITPGSSSPFAVTILRTGARYSVPTANILGDDWFAGG